MKSMNLLLGGKKLEWLTINVNTLAIMVSRQPREECLL